MASIKYTKHLLSKIEELLQELDYTVRYAKGRFQSGYCLVEQQKIAVVNKFFETEGRINVLIEILDTMEIEEASLSDKALKTYQQVRKAKEAAVPDLEETIRVEEEIEAKEQATKPEGLSEAAKQILKQKVQDRIRAKIKVKKRKSDEK